MKRKKNKKSRSEQPAYKKNPAEIPIQLLLNQAAHFYNKTLKNEFYFSPHVDALGNFSVSFSTCGKEEEAKELITFYDRLMEQEEKFTQQRVELSFLCDGFIKLCKAILNKNKEAS